MKQLKAPSAETVGSDLNAASLSTFNERNHRKYPVYTNICVCLRFDINTIN